ncbi:MAG: YjgN family protein [Dongiaceae bacterium]
MATESSAGGLPAGLEEQRLVYDGRLGAIYGIFIKTLLLAIVTLGIYRFWGKTNMRRYVWSHVSFQGDRLEYTGTGGELFKGFIIVVGFVFIAGIARTALELAFGSLSAVAVVAQLLFIVAVVYLAFVAHYAAQRYRLTRTLWRGIRGGVSGSAWSYGIKAMLYSLISSFTFFLAQPWASFRLLELRLNNSYLGDAKALASLQASEVFGRYIAGYGIMLVLFVGFIALAILAVGSSGLAQDFLEIIQATAEGRTPDTTQVDMTSIAIALGLFYAGFAVWGILGSTIAFAWYWAGVAGEVAARLEVAGLRFRSDITAGGLIGLYIGNMLIVVFTLGLGLPIALHRSLRFFTGRYGILGRLDPDRLTQTTLDRPRTGEGLLEAFDPGLF